MCRAEKQQTMDVKQVTDKDRAEGALQGDRQLKVPSKCELQ